MAPVGRDRFDTVDNLATSAGALDHSVRAVQSNNLIDAGSAVGIQPVYRNGHLVRGRHSSHIYLLPISPMQ
jgi:hypothetical protein